MLGDGLCEGSSPRVRGKHDVKRSIFALSGLIPACAGKTSRKTRLSVRRPAHPRVCGENLNHAHAVTPDQGSSPRVRGKPRWRQRATRSCGLIPACAGKTLGLGFARKLRRAHPRVCGENIVAGTEFKREKGSSPRVRGKREAGVVGDCCDRLIPACAGKTRIPFLSSTAARAHPRVCGENSGRHSIPIERRGSSPRVRGKPGNPGVNNIGTGLIPACAGKTKPRHVSTSTRWAHPRVCGEN